MDYEEEKGFMFAHTYGLDTDELIEIIAREILKLDLPEGDRKYKLNINVVKTKKNNKLGYSFLWINNIKIFNALMGLNFDGSERTELIEDEEDEPLTLTGTNWGDTTSKIEYKHLEPLISFPPVKLNEEDQKNYRLFNDEADFSIDTAKLYYNREFIMKNSIFTKGVPEWLEENKIKKFFKTFEKDDRTHTTKNGRFSYPIVKIKNAIVNISFSKQNPNLASFIINMAKKVKFYDEDRKRECLLIFKQNKIRRYD
jgi:hypothetical protein